eukprot:CAMPEP_0168839246 /NCGR_PEP_ID=MMETSP0727-20121128/6057_1 /TAXON_ID=265536 /ORGANISM="Amphiprora sp., Strain CCMP467" /LENGTH=44 /DNA_ID= /DNA_START= /DNA_END= /DNA_ORIENTATION=
MILWSGRRITGGNRFNRSNPKSESCIWVRHASVRNKKNISPPTR